jgi:uncharacterized tellurite resistance protein B-like protein
MNTFLHRLKSLLERPPVPAADTQQAPYRRRDVAVVALLIELARIDRSMTPNELETIGRIVREWFGLDPATAAGLIDAAQAELDAALEDWIFANAVRTGFGESERIEIVCLLWQIVYADGRLARLEETLVDRLAVELGVDGANLAQARAQAYARVGSRDGADTCNPEAE